ncbi:cytochrome c oxidase assembly protein [Luteococcus japonicus]|uniref:cytochrome c oxidase assembly protein n=1 Tax=Luteococcus japonicus TaxID=33984 RepID=UPI000B9C51EB|nr:cytochrome c oxidase assembly protein [Luteococcus japonicus]
MSDSSDDVPARRLLSTGTVLAIWLTIGAAVPLTTATSVLLAQQPPLPGRPGADALTGLVALLGDVIARFAGAATLGLLAAIVVFSPSRAGDTPRRPDERLRRWLARSAQVWFAASVLMTFANPSFVEGIAVAGSFRADAWWLFVTSTASGLAWVASSLAALAIVMLGWWGRGGTSFGLAWLAGAAATVFVAVTGGVSVGLDHDWATDAVGLATLASVTLCSGAVGALVAMAVDPDSRVAAIRRYHRSAPILVGVGAVGYGIGAWQQLAGVSPFATVFGLPVVGGFSLGALLVASWLWRQFAERTSDAASWRRSTSSVARDVVLLTLSLTSLTAATYLSPPRYLVPQSVQINYLGYEMNVPATLARLAGFGRPNLLWLLLAAAAIGLYLWGVVRVTRRGGRWPLSRLLFWLGGWGLTVYLSVSGLWMYSTAVFSWHMLVHMTVNMMVPVLCVLGAPLSLVYAASRARLPGEFVGVQELLGRLTQNRLVRVLLSPPLVWLNYVGSLFLVYFSPLFPWLMRYHWGHQMMLLHFVVAGYAFFALLVGPDRHPWQLPYIVRFALLLSIMPFHAIFAVGIMESRTILGEQFYRSIDVSWVGDLLHNQNIAGQVTWFTGEIPAFVAVIMLAAQWFRSDSSQAAAADLLADAGGSGDELAAYNDMLAELAGRDRG